MLQARLLKKVPKTTSGAQVSHEKLYNWSLSLLVQRENFFPCNSKGDCFLGILFALSDS